MLNKKQKKFAGIIIAIASLGLVLSSVGGSLYYLFASH
jgi:hypothetical protein